MSRVRNVDVPSETRPEDALTLLAAANDEDGSREKVQELLAREPAWIERLGALASEAEDAVVAQVGEQVLVQEAARAELARTRESLLLPSDGPLERMIVCRVALCWLNLTMAEAARARRLQKCGASEATSFWDRHVSRLNGDFLRASKTLATVRRLRLPTLRVNVERQQVNLTPCCSLGTEPTLSNQLS